MDLTFFFFSSGQKCEESEWNNLWLTLPTPLLYFPSCASPLPIILWDWLDQTSLLLSLLDVPIFPKVREPQGPAHMGRLNRVFREDKSIILS